MALKKSYGEAISTDDTIEIQGELYRLRPMGIGVIRRLLQAQAQAAANSDEAASALANMDAAIDVLRAGIVEEDHDRLNAQIESSMSMSLIGEIATDLVQGQSDLDPTQLQSLPTGSPPTGSNSMDGARPVVSTPSI